MQCELTTRQANVIMEIETTKTQLRYVTFPAHTTLRKALGGSSNLTTVDISATD